jgi:hypothetical protein
MSLQSFTFDGGKPHAERRRGGGRGWLQRRFGPAFDLTVVGVSDLTPRMRRISLIGDDLGRLDWVPGQDLVLELPLPGGERAGAIRSSCGSTSTWSGTAPAPPANGWPPPGSASGSAPSARAVAPGSAPPPAAICSSATRPPSPPSSPWPKPCPAAPRAWP